MLISILKKSKQSIGESKLKKGSGIVLVLLFNKFEIRNDILHVI